MDRKEYLQALESLKLSQSRAGEFFVKNPVTGRRWALASGKGAPRPVAMFLRLMIALKLTPAKVVEMIGDKDPKRVRIDASREHAPRERDPYAGNARGCGAPAKYPFKNMNVGDSKFFATAGSVAAAHSYGRRHKQKFSSKKIEDRWKITRVY